jgi:hypothetical protein
MKDEDRSEAFDRFMEGVNGLLADRTFREVLLELDREGEEAASLLASDPAAFLKFRGVQIPEDFRLSVEKRVEGEATAAAVGTGPGTDLGPGTRQPRVVCYCLKICWWRWCIEICVCRIEY